MPSLEPHPWLPQWHVKLGPIVRRGEGLLPRDLFPFKDNFDEFRVFCGGFELVAKPKTGQILADSQVSAMLPLPCSLVWFRRMQQDINTRDPNSATATCLWYGIGLESNGHKQGYRIREDGVAKWGDFD